jgi:hypothetical protein
MTEKVADFAGVKPQPSGYFVSINNIYKQNGVVSLKSGFGDRLVLDRSLNLPLQISTNLVSRVVDLDGKTNLKGAFQVILNTSVNKMTSFFVDTETGNNIINNISNNINFKELFTTEVRNGVTFAKLIPNTNPVTINLAVVNNIQTFKYLYGEGQSVFNLYTLNDGTTFLVPNK